MIKLTKTKLQIMREKRGLTVEQLSKKIVNLAGGKVEIDYMTLILYKYEDGISKLKISKYNNNVEIIAQALDCSVEDLVEE